ncbi:MAG: Flp pilus assembly protein CpaB [Actinomycetota bacterium]
MFLRRISRTSKLFAVLAVGAGLGAFLLVRSYTQRLDALRPLAGEPVPVVVAAAAIARGTTLSADDLREALVPAAYAPPGAVDDAGSLEGRTLLTEVREGEPVSVTRLAPEGAGPVAALVPPEFRAVTVASSLPAGAVRAGDLVDVMGTFGGGRPHTETVATGLEVLLSLDDGQSASIGEAGGVADVPSSPGSLTASGPTLVLLVSPSDAERLAYAQAFAELTVAIAGAA